MTVAMPTLPRTTLVRRFWDKVGPQTSFGCWLWNGAITAEGYGSIRRGRRDEGCLYAHRLSYELHHGPIPDELTIDHLCRNRSCVNPTHLEPVTRGENVRRGVRAREADRKERVRG